MRQAGVLAAAGIYALDNIVPTLKRDHANAQIFAKGQYCISSSKAPGVTFKPCKSHTTQTAIMAENQVNQPPPPIPHFFKVSILQKRARGVKDHLMKVFEKSVQIYHPYHFCFYRNSRNERSWTGCRS